MGLRGSGGWGLKSFRMNHLMVPTGPADTPAISNTSTLERWTKILHQTTTKSIHPAKLVPAHTHWRHVALDLVTVFSSGKQTGTDGHQLQDGCFRHY